MKSISRSLYLVLIASLLTLSSSGTTFAGGSSKASEANLKSIDVNTERNADGGKINKLQTPDGNSKTIAKQNVAHLAVLMRMRRLFPFGHRRVVAYAGMKYDAQGKPRLKEMIGRLKDLGVNCYSYLIDSHSVAELKALPQFCQLASKIHLEVWVVLVPPTEEPGLEHGSRMRYPPYGLDYQKWAEAIGRVSGTCHNLTLLMIDDFLYNTSYFTPDYIKKIHAILERGNPNLLLGVTIYENQLNKMEKIRPYIPYVNAVEWGYQHKASLSPSYGISAASLPGNINEFAGIFPDAILIPCIYFTPHSSWSREATSTYLKEAMTTAYRQAGVVLVFRTPYRDTKRYELVKKFCSRHILSHGK